MKSEFQPECPVCSNKMKYGYITDVHIRWVENGQEKSKASYPLMEKNPYIKRFFHNWWIAPAYACDGCRLAIGKWNLNHRNSAERATTEEKTMTSCPYCGGHTKSGRVYGNRGIRWASDVGNMFLKKIKFIEPVPLFKQIGLPARMCKECGIIMVRYKPQKTWLQILKIITILSMMGAIILIIAIMLFTSAGFDPEMPYPILALMNS